MQKLFVLGHPVAHSKSPAMYNAVYQQLGLDWFYDFADCETEQQAQAFLDARDFISINITTPYKPLAFANASISTSSAVLAQGANVLIAKDGKLIADNTDGIGCVSYLKRRGVAFEGAQIAICGTGPAARAIMHACALAGAGKVTLLGRDSQRAVQVIEDYRANLWLLTEHAGEVIDALDPRYAQANVQQILQGCNLGGTSYDEGVSAIAEAGLIIDATRLGMQPGDPAPFNTALISNGQTVFDLVYAHGETALIKAARAAGAAAYDGEGMLVAQAVATLHGIECTLGLPVPSDSIDLFEVMAQAAGFTSLVGAN